MANEAFAGDTWLYSKFTGDAVLRARIGARVFVDFAPETDTDLARAVEYPLIVFGLQSARESVGMGGERLLVEPLYRILAIGKGAGYGAIQDIADRMDALLQPSPPVVETVSVGGSSYLVYGCYRERLIQYAEAQAGGIRYNYLGGLYRPTIEQT